MRPEELYVYKTLLEVGAKSGQSTDIGHGLSLATWMNDDSYAEYERASHHTLSYYIQGGKKTRRHFGEHSVGRGHPGAVCVMPAGVESEWSIEAPFQFMHLYFDRNEFDRQIAESYDVDPALVELHDLTFISDPVIERLCRDVIIPLDWQNHADKMSLSLAGQLLVQHLLRNYTNRELSPSPSRGGIAPFVLKRVRDFIETSLDRGITVGELAGIAELSPFHFTRMFQQSVGVSPHQYVLGRRIEKAKDLLGENEFSLTEVAQICGFSSQSHLTTRFRCTTGMTPKSFRRLS
ncbi:helix-turn-helix transcriptional regulator [Kiloniella antarctica]|uniref:Helix-turn-helix domain-containing protein n=1 Tax=Kiloniella antarctica TaxID=1550907 RepID=A0ABW5BJX4_9PROT